MCETEVCKGGKECLPGVSDGNLVGKTAEVFVDDTIVKSQEVEDHVNDLATVLVRLIANGITLKMERASGEQMSCHCWDIWCIWGKE